jgi:hypothetical protein
LYRYTKVTAMDARLKLYPSTLKVDASMGSLQVVDPRLPLDHPYRWIVRPAEQSGVGLCTLIQVDP